MPERPVVGSLSQDRLRAMIAVAAPAHPKIAFELETLEVAAAAIPPEDGAPAFIGPRPTARSGESWDADTVIRALQEVSREVEASGRGEESLVTVRNLEPSLAQSVLTEVALEKGWATETPDGRVEWIQFDKLDPGWIGSVVERIKSIFKGRAKRPNLPEIPEELPNACRIALVGDWGTGLYGAPEFTRWASAQPAWDAVVHLGDTYYSGTKKEVAERISKLWPVPADAATLSRFLNGNHEMYSGGEPYFQFIKSFKQVHPQPSSCFAMQNDHWLIVGLDTAWHGFEVEPAMRSGHFDPEQVAWLVKLVQNSGDRQVMLLSHHQPFHFTGSENDELTDGLQPLWDTNKVRLWYWGHEHSAAFYDTCKFGFNGRCLGHGGMPEGRPKVVRKSTEAQPIAGTDCSWKGVTTTVGTLPLHTWVLDGPNPLVTFGSPDDFAPHGWATLIFDGANVAEEWYLADGAQKLPSP